MDYAMELDDFKTTWQALDQRLSQLNEMSLEILRERKTTKAAKGLRPLFWWQIAQIIIAIPILIGAVQFWHAHLDRIHLFAAGIVMHAYAIALIASAGQTLSYMRKVDYAAPVVTIQKQLAQLQRWHARSTMVLGHAWWLLWIPLTMIVFAWGIGLDIQSYVPLFLVICMGIGIAGLLGTGLFYAWAIRAGRDALAKDIAGTTPHPRIVEAQAAIDAITQFEQE